MLLNALTAQVLCIDMQDKLIAAMAGRESMLANAQKICAAADLLNIPIIATEQNPEKLGRTDPSIAQYIKDFMPKLAFSAVDEVLMDLLMPEPAPSVSQQRGASAKSIPKHLRKTEPIDDRDNIVVFGAEAHICVLQTALELIEQDLMVWVVTDACGSRSMANRDAAYDRLAANGAELITTEMFVFECLRSADHPQFKKVQALIK